MLTAEELLSKGTGKTFGELMDRVTEWQEVARGRDFDVRAAMTEIPDGTWYLFMLYECAEEYFHAPPLAPPAATATGEGDAAELRAISKKLTEEIRPVSGACRMLDELVIRINTVARRLASRG